MRKTSKFRAKLFLINHVRGSGGISLVRSFARCWRRNESAEVPATLLIRWLPQSRDLRGSAACEHVKTIWIMHFVRATGRLMLSSRHPRSLSADPIQA